MEKTIFGPSIQWTEGGPPKLQFTGPGIALIRELMTTTQRKVNPIEYFGPTETHEKALASNAMSSPLSLSTYKNKKIIVKTSLKTVFIF